MIPRSPSCGRAALTVPGITPQGGSGVPGLLQGSVSGTFCPRGLIWKPQLIFPLNK